MSAAHANSLEGVGRIALEIAARRAKHLHAICEALRDEDQETAVMCMRRFFQLDTECMNGKTPYCQSCPLCDKGESHGKSN